MESNDTDLLDRILKYKQHEVAQLRKQTDINPFYKLLKSESSTLIIAEVKHKSPSQGMLLSRSVPNLLKHYVTGHADALSVVTDSKYFGGSTQEFKRIRARTTLPILKKDFVIDTAQIVDAYQLKADAVLLIARIVSALKLKLLVTLVEQLAMVPVVEIFDAQELPKAIGSGAYCIAVNVRDLDTQTLNQTNALQILKSIPNNRIKLLFSGMQTRADVLVAQEAGARAVLVGTSLLKSKSPAQTLKELKGLV